MKKYLFIDTETAGLPYDYDLPATYTDNWPRLVQVAFMLTDEKRSVIEEGSMIIRPDDFVIPAEASAVHGITTRRARREGIALELALMKIELLASEADVLVGHNISFDQHVIDAEFVRIMNKTCLDRLPSHCTMLESAEYCHLTDYDKWPKLIELHEILFNEGFSGAHDALADVRATERCFWKLVDLRVIRLQSSETRGTAATVNSAPVVNPVSGQSQQDGSKGCLPFIWILIAIIVFCWLL